MTAPSWPPTRRGSPQPAQDAGVQRAVQAILGFLALHPGAADSAQGITQWWLPSMQAAGSLAQVQAALAVLQRRGLVVAQPLPDGGLIYRARR